MIWFLLLVVITAVTLALYWPSFSGTRGALRLEAPRQAPFLYPDPSPLQAFFDVVVDERHRVDYPSALGPAHQQLGNYLGQVAAATPAAFADDNQRLAFYINAYNALVIEGVLTNWPISSVEEVGSLHKFFRDRVYTVAGVVVSLHGFETKVIRKYDPRLHFALNCASASCPPLSRFVYRPETLEEQLETAAAEFINNPVFNSYDRTTGTWRISMIFKWYAQDFGGEKGVRALLAHHTGIASDEATLVYQPYDWSLNNASP